MAVLGRDTLQLLARDLGVPVEELEGAMLATGAGLAVAGESTAQAAADALEGLVRWLRRPLEPLPQPRPPRAPTTITLDGEPWLIMAGSPEVFDGPYLIVRHATRKDADDYIQGGRGFTLTETSPKLALVRRMAVRPAATRRWDELSESTKRGYRGRIRSLGIRSEAEIARFHDTADSATLKWLRRHGPKPPDLIVRRGTAYRPARGRGSWATVWEQGHQR